MEQVLGVLRRADDPVDVHLELTPVRVGQLAERILVASACTREHLVGHARILAPTVPFTRITAMTSARPEIRRSISLAANASTHATPTSPSKEIQMRSMSFRAAGRLTRWETADGNIGTT